MGSRSLDKLNANNDIVSRLRREVDATTHAFVNKTKLYYSGFQSFVLAGAAAVVPIQMQVYPNPTTNQATLEAYHLYSPDAVRIEVLSPLGQVARTLTVRPVAGSLRTTIDLSGLPAGIFFVRMHTPTGTVEKRLVKE